MRTKAFAAAAAMAVGMMGFGSGASALTLNFDSTSISSNTPATGASASVDISFSDQEGDVLTTLKIANTTGSSAFGSGATASKLTGIAFDLPQPVSYVANSLTQVEGDSGDFFFFVNADNALSPFGTVDLSVTDNNNFEGGNANDALPQSQNTIVTFLLDTLLNATEFSTAFAALLPNTTANNSDNGFTALARFQQVSGDNFTGASDKLKYQFTPVPLPAAVWMLLAGLGGLGLLGRRRRAV